VKLKQFRASRVGFFCALLSLSFIFYFVDCLLSFRDHPDVPWFESGIYAGGPIGFLATVLCVVFAFGYLIFGRDE
jgi:hypothetical protein